MPLRLALSLWTWLALVVVSTAGFLLLLPLWLCTAPWDANRLWVGSTFRRVARLAIGCIPWWRFDVRAPVPKVLERPCVVVSNHESHLDAFLISHLPWEMKWLAKNSLFRLPIIGWSMALAGDVAVVRGTRASSERALATCRSYLDNGMSVFLFPEGTRAVGEALQPFKSGAFRLALEAGCPVLPLAVAGTQRGLVKGSMLFRPCRARVAVGTPVEVGPYRSRFRGTDPAGGTDIDLTAASLQLAADVRAQITALRDSLRAELAQRRRPAAS